MHTVKGIMHIRKCDLHRTYYITLWSKQAHTMAAFMQCRMSNCGSWYTV